MTHTAKIVGFLFLVLGLSACKKSTESLPDPAPEATLSRTLVFPNQGGLVKDARYEGSGVLKTRAFLENGLLYLFLDSETPAKAGDAILLAIDTSNLQSGPVKTYRFGGNPDAIRQARYTFSYTRSDGSTWGSITDSKFGVQYTGELVITGWDAGRKLISGRFTITAPDLMNDPTRESIAEPIDPFYFCTLGLEGHFSNLKIQ